MSTEGVAGDAAVDVKYAQSCICVRNLLSLRTSKF